LLWTEQFRTKKDLSPKGNSGLSEQVMFFSFYPPLKNWDYLIEFLIEKQYQFLIILKYCLGLPATHL